VWGDWEAPYLTLNPAYEAAQLGVFGRMFLNGHIYRGRKPVHWSPSSRTALAEAVRLCNVEQLTLRDLQCGPGARRLPRAKARFTRCSPAAPRRWKPRVILTSFVDAGLWQNAPRQPRSVTTPHRSVSAPSLHAACRSILQAQRRNVAAAHLTSQRTDSVMPLHHIAVLRSVAAASQPSMHKS